jgi:hypothetical protein
MSQADKRTRVSRTYGPNGFEQRTAMGEKTTTLKEPYNGQDLPPGKYLGRDGAEFAAITTLAPLKQLRTMPMERGMPRSMWWQKIIPRSVYKVSPTPLFAITRPPLSKNC